MWGHASSESWVRIQYSSWSGVLESSSSISCATCSLGKGADYGSSFNLTTFRATIPNSIIRTTNHESGEMDE
jgi:hypothetical protein